MNTKLILLMLVVSTMTMMAWNLLNTTPAFADKTSGQQGVNTADAAIHNAPPQADANFHNGTCNGGFSAGGYPC